MRRSRVFFWLGLAFLSMAVFASMAWALGPKVWWVYLPLLGTLPMLFVGARPLPELRSWKYGHFASRAAWVVAGALVGALIFGGRNGSAVFAGAFTAVALLLAFVAWANAYHQARKEVNTH